MKWFRYLYGVILGVVMISVSVSEGFDTTRGAVVSGVFIVIGAGLVGVMIWAAVRDLRRWRESVTSVPEPDDAGMGFFRRERAEQERAEGGRTDVGHA